MTEQQVYMVGIPIVIAMIAIEPAVSLWRQRGVYEWYDTWGSLGPLEWILNTPSHHRVHHGSNPQYIDKNYSNWLIIWDRIFGETMRIVFGPPDRVRAE